jgi:ATP-dependent helicase Lhr and Lhr-like helicase
MEPLFHHIVTKWFRNKFQEPTEIQQQSWLNISQGKNVLIAAPTGSGKTFAAFLKIIDDLVQKNIQHSLPEKTLVVYISPLKALSNDIERNLKGPLQEIDECLLQEGYSESGIRIALRTGDTPVSERTGMLKNPPHILVTTPESLYILLTTVNGRRMLSDVERIIVDEIHAMVNDKRGSHLSLSMERLQKLSSKSLQRIGISATQKPIEEIAAFLTGVNNGIPQPCEILDTGHSRAMQISITVPNSPLTAVMANEVWDEIYQKLVDNIQQHTTTLIFVNTRKLAERLANQLTTILGEEVITAHHGSMSKDNRFEAEQRLKAGKLKALVATASLELGIDVGAVDLVCQIGSPKSIAVFLQRVGRSGHSIKGTPKGILFPLTRDELLECTAILDAVRRKELDAVIIPQKPVDILAQQLVAEVACEEYDETELYEMVRRAYPYRDLSQNEFAEIIKMLSEGFTTRRGRRAAYLHHDLINAKLRGRKGARLTAIISGGAIPDNFDYDVIQEPVNLFVGTLNEDFAIESTPGDIFQLGNNSWRVLRIETGKVKVEDAGGLPPSIPFWLGEAPGRTDELSFAVSRLMQTIADHLGDLTEVVMADTDQEATDIAPWKVPAMKWLKEELKLSEEVCDQLVTYVAIAKISLGLVPTQDCIVMERFFDEAGDMHLVIHSPFGSRLNKAWGLSLRKRFCKKFNFELQAAATENALILSLGSTHSFPIEEVFDYLKPATVKEILIQAMLDSPIFEVRWRWNASRALAVLRRYPGKKVPPQIQRMQSEDLIALVFPDQIACFENIQGPREVPRHPLVDQTIHDCLTEAMDLKGLEVLLEKIVNRKIQLVARDLREPSPLAQEIINARPYAFLDDAPLEERRTRAILNRRWLDPAEAGDLSKLDPRAIEMVRLEAWPDVASADDLHDALTLLGYVREEESLGMASFKQELVAQNRLTVLSVAPNKKVWLAAERVPEFMALYGDPVFDPKIVLPKKFLLNKPEKLAALVELIRGRLEGLGPITVSRISNELEISAGEVEMALIHLEQEGFVFRGNFTGESDETEWCERRLLSRIHRYTLEKVRKEIEPVSPADFMRFLFAWQGLDNASESLGPVALQKTLEMLEGIEAPAIAWEADIIPARVKDYDYIWLDVLCMSGKIAWGRFRPPQFNTANTQSKSTTPVKSTPLMIVSRTKLSAWKNRYRKSDEDFRILSNNALKVHECLLKGGALFFDEILRQTGLLNSQAEEALAELVNIGEVTADSYTGLRALLVPAKYKGDNVSKRKKKIDFTMDQAGRWTLLKNNFVKDDEEDFTKVYAKLLLKRYGIVCRKIADKEKGAPAWRELVKYYRMLELKGEIRGGRFIDGVWGEHFALPEAVTMLREIRKKEKDGAYLAVNAADPLNFHGVITPGEKIPQYTSNRVLYQDGVVVALSEGGEIRYLRTAGTAEKWKMKTALEQRNYSPKLRAYLGKGIG